MRLTSALLCAALAACTAASEPPVQAQAQTEPYKCLLPGEQRMLVAELFFGRDIPGRAPLTDAEWTEFAVRTLTPNFPDGFTAFNGDGQWQNPINGRTAHEPTKILLIAAKRQADLAPRLTAVIEAYKAKFHQQSVGVITRDSCASF